MLKSERWRLDRYELLGEPAVRFLGPDVAVVAYKVKEEMKVEGKHCPIRGHSVRDSGGAGAVPQPLEPTANSPGHVRALYERAQDNGCIRAPGLIGYCILSI